MNRFPIINKGMLITGVQEHKTSAMKKYYLLWPIEIRPIGVEAGTWIFFC